MADGKTMGPKGASAPGAPGAGGGVSLEDLRRNAASLGRVAAYALSRYRLAVAAVVACIVVASIAQVRSSLFVGELIDEHILPLLGSGEGDLAPLAGALISLAAICAAGVVATYAYNRIMVTVSQGTMRRLREELFRRMESLPIRYFDTHAHGDVMSVYTNDVDTLRQLLSQAAPQLASSAITVVVTLASMVWVSWQLTIVSLAMLALMVRVTGKVGGLASTLFTRQQADLGDLDGYIEEMVEGQRVVKVFCHEEAAVRGFREVNGRLRESATSANACSNMLMPLLANIGTISYVLCALVGGALALMGGAGALTLGGLVAFLSLNKSFTQPITQISQQMNAISMAGAGASRVFAMLDEEPEDDEGTVELVCAEHARDGSLAPAAARTGLWAWSGASGEGGPALTALRGDIEFEHVGFGYAPGKPVLRDVSLTARSGQKIALVGSTGAGKTTVANLINRFYDIDEGEIRYDGIPIGDMRKAALRRSLGIVLQDTHLFSDTVLENIRYGRLDATDEECREAARRVSADGFIRRLPEGYDTWLAGEGAALSQGQRQLIAIARAALCDPPVLILDEATSSIDTRTEELVQRGMDALMAGRTSFVIAHRLSTVRDADCIMVMENGSIIERGRHEELLERRGRYWQLYTGGEVG